MKFLALLPRVVYPADTGAKKRTLNMFKRLSEKGDEATLVCYRSPEDTDGDVEKMRQICTQLEIVPWEEAVTFSPTSYLLAAKNLVSPYPYAVEKYHTPNYAARVRKLCAQERYDAIIVDTVCLALPVFDIDRLPRVCFEHNVEYVIRRRQYEKERNPLLKAFLYYDYVRMKRIEQDVGQRFDHMIMVSSVDCDTLADEVGVTNTSSIPLGVDVHFFAPTEPDPSQQSLDLVFTGSMDWLPNDDGITWFLEEVMPRIHQEVPEATLTIVGRKPSPGIQALVDASPKVSLTGWVDDVRPYVAKGALFVVPLRIGGGTRIKIFEGMAMGKAVVSTTIGAEGLPVHHGQDIVLADTPEAFANDVIRLLRNEAARRKLGEAARKLMVEKYSWENAADVFAEICHKVVGARRDDAAPSNL